MHYMIEQYRSWILEDEVRIKITLARNSGITWHGAFPRDYTAVRYGMNEEIWNKVQYGIGVTSKNNNNKFASY